MFGFQEDFLHLVWKYQYFDKKLLQTSQGLPLSILKIGYHNRHEGPDFMEAQIQLDGIDYFGHIEIHMHSSDWKNHQHQRDTRYNAVILHVVWKHDQEPCREDGTTIPTLELQGKVMLDVVRNYERLLFSQRKILCSEGLSLIPEILRFSMLEKALVERLQQKSEAVLGLLEQNQNDWEETAYQWLFYCFGFKTNSDAMLKLAKSLSFKLLKKNSGRPEIQEALVFGQAGMLNAEQGDEYYRKLRQEYLFLVKKYNLKNGVYPGEWKFMKVRPSNYPTIRLAQVAVLLGKSPNLFSNVLYELDNRETFHSILKVEVSAYWRTHHYFGKENKKRLNGALSQVVLDLLAINFVIPLWYAYGRFSELADWQEKCFNFLQDIPAEQNGIIRKYEEEGWEPHNAYDSQGMLGLFNHYCSHKKCLDCKIGQTLLRPSLK
ncbi:DUF2851 family protein [Negadavirga shengliensis]|uniref:DUF2851 family protein n=1 Tax=Negadavirga shengliensis TaxID=1389218 RepID=A0ABV9T554_9BACT